MRYLAYVQFLFSCMIFDESLHYPRVRIPLESLQKIDDREFGTGQSLENPNWKCHAHEVPPRPRSLPQKPLHKATASTPYVCLYRAAPHTETQTNSTTSLVYYGIGVSFKPKFLTTDAILSCYDTRVRGTRLRVHERRVMGVNSLLSLHNA